MKYNSQILGCPFCSLGKDKFLFSFLALLQCQTILEHMSPLVLKVESWVHKIPKSNLYFWPDKQIKRVTVAKENIVLKSFHLFFSIFSQIVPEGDPQSVKCNSSGRLKLWRSLTFKPEELGRETSSAINCRWSSGEDRTGKRSWLYVWIKASVGRQR